MKNYARLLVVAALFTSIGLSIFGNHVPVQAQRTITATAAQDNKSGKWRVVVTSDTTGYTVITSGEYETKEEAEKEADDREERANGNNK